MMAGSTWPIASSLTFHRIGLDHSSIYRAVMKVEIGKGSTIFMDAWFETVGSIAIGVNSSINQRCRLAGRGGLTFGDNVLNLCEACILTTEHDIQSPDFCGKSSPILIEAFVFVGTRRHDLPGAS
jgi:acetyltransferase-like isoleucine patch superfamily enzyme